MRQAWGSEFQKQRAAGPRAWVERSVPSCWMWAEWPLEARDAVGRVPRDTPAADYWVPPKRSRSPLPTATTGHKIVTGDSPAVRIRGGIFSEKEDVMVTVAEALLCARHFHKITRNPHSPTRAATLIPLREGDMKGPRKLCVCARARALVISPTGCEYV